ncbi:MAG: ATP-binding cassette domain-containing protein [Gemmatimonadaceae bacterium]
MAAALELCGVMKWYRAGMSGCVAAVRALDGVSLRVEPGEVVAVVGEEGAGKTTLLHCAAGLLRPDGGTVGWFGAVGGVGAGRVPDAVAFVPARVSYYPFLTIRETLDHYAALHHPLGLGDRERAAGWALERVGLAERCGERVARLASGVLRRLALAQALLARPRLLLLDAPLAGLEGDARRAVAAFVVESAREGVAVLLTARAAAGLEGVVTRAEWLSGGRLSRAPGGGELESGERALELRVASPSADQAALATALAGRGGRAGRCCAGASAARPIVERRGELLRVALDAASPEEVLAHCRAIGVVVYESRVVPSDGERRVAERGG